MKTLRTKGLGLRAEPVCIGSFVLSTQSLVLS